MKLNVAASTDPGLLHDHNEDFFVVRRKLGLFIVADGVGGADAGEVASMVGCRLIEQSLQAKEPGTDRTRHDVLLTHAIREANHGLYEYGRHDPEKGGVGTTITALWFHGDRVLFAYVGDSRIYLYRDGVLRQLSRDEKVGSYRLAASLGQGPAVEPHLGMVRLRRGDRFLLCTDGLHSIVPHADLTTTMDAEPDPKACCDRLIAAANKAGGPDNITALVADVVEPAPPQRWRFSRARLDATSPLTKLLRAPVWLGLAATAALAVLLIIWGTSLGPKAGRHTPTPVTGRLAVLAREASNHARRGDRDGSVRALKDIVREAIHQRKPLGRAALALDPAAARLFAQAANAVWDELYAPTRQKLDGLDGTPAQRFVEAEVRATRERIEHVRKQFLADDFRFVAETFASLDKEVATIVQRAHGDLASEKGRLSGILAELKADASEFEDHNPLRRTLDARIADAEKALQADDLAEAQKQIGAATAALKRDEPDPRR